MPITIVTGPPGAGKTTISAAVARSRPLGVHLPTDHWYHWIANGYVPPWKPESNTQNAAVVRAVAAAARQYSDFGYDVVVDGVVGPWFLDHFLDAAGEQPAAVTYVILRPAPAVALERAITRSGEEDLTSADVVGALFRAFEDLGRFERHVIDSSAQDPAATTATVLAALSSGTHRLSPAHDDDQRRLAKKFSTPPVVARDQ